MMIFKDTLHLFCLLNEGKEDEGDKQVLKLQG
jgi:hypothetical protein